MTLRKFTLLFFIFVGMGCASYSNKNNSLTRNEMEAMHAFATMNKQIWGEYGIDHDEYTKFNIKEYEHILNKGKSDAASEAKRFYDSLSPKVVYATDLSYVICGYSDKYDIAICDDAACENIEQITKETIDKDISLLREKISNPGRCK